MKSKVEKILGYNITNIPLDELSKSLVAELIRGSNKSLWIACFNPHSYAIAKNDILFSNALHDADYLVPDGIGVILASHLLGGKLRRRLTGPDFFKVFNQDINNMNNVKVFLLGSTTETLNKIKNKLNKEYNNIKVTGFFSPPYKENFSAKDNEQMIKAINNSNSDILWVAMTAPKQEKWVFENKENLNVKFIFPIGAAFDFYVGNIKRSNIVFRNNGMEWLPRLIQEPKRLWRRTLISAPIFILDSIKERISKFFYKRP